MTEKIYLGSEVWLWIGYCDLVHPLDIYPGVEGEGKKEKYICVITFVSKLKYHLFHPGF